MELTNTSFDLSKNLTFQTANFEKLQSNKSIRSSSMDSSNTSNSIYNKLHLRITEFEDQIFPALQLPTMQNKEKKRKKGRKRQVFIKEEKHSRVFVKFSITNTRKEAISSTTDYLVHSEALGPGRYERISLNPLPKGNISAVPRFNNGILQIASDYVKGKTKNPSSDIIEKNLDLSPFSKDKKIEKILTQAKLREFEEAVHKKTRISLEGFDREKKNKKYCEKNSKFEWWLKKEEIQFVKKSWGSLLAAFGFALAMQMTILSKISRKARIKKNFNILGILCRFVGKIGIRLKNFRYRKLVLSFNMHSKHLRNWLETRKSFYKGIIRDIIDKAFMGNYITQFMGLFKKKIIFIQHQLKNILKVKRARNWGLIILFNKLEKQATSSRSGKRVARKTSYDIDVEIRKYYVKVATEFVKKNKRFKEELKTYQETQNKIMDNENFLVSHESLAPPKKPIFILYTRTKDILKRMKTSFGLDGPIQDNLLKKQTKVSPALRKQSISK